VTCYTRCLSTYYFFFHCSVINAEASVFFVACGNVDVDCEGSETALPLAGNEQLPAGWSLAVPCAINSTDGVIDNVIVTYLTTTTPKSCIQSCAARGFKLTRVQFSDNCYCRNSYLNNQLLPADVSDCEMHCMGDVNITCEGAWSLQVYKLGRRLFACPPNRGEGCKSESGTLRSLMRGGS
jgi:hypothetical protein